MKEDIFSGKWHQIKGKLKEKWGKLTDQDITRINGKREQLLGLLQERYGWQKQHAEDELKRFEQLWDKEKNSSRPQREDTFESSHREIETNREKEDSDYEKNRDNSSRDWDKKERRKDEEDEEGGENRSKKRKII